MGIPGYDAQSADYDKRVGMGDELSKQVAEGVFDYCKNPELATLLDVGCGTGEIGQYLLQLSDEYVGLDRSSGMLEKFKERLSSLQIQQATLFEADGNEHWPVDDHSIDILFSSRALHLLDLQHVVSEIQRISSTNGITLIIGRVTKDKHGIAQTMRRQMRKILENHGVKGRSGKQNLDAVTQACTAVGADELSATTVATWQVSQNPLQSLDSWRAKSGLAGVDVSDQIRNDILEELESWAIKHYGSLQHTEESLSRYELHGFHFTK